MIEHEWHAQVAKGDAGLAEVVAWLEGQELEVTRVDADRAWRDRDIDLLVSGNGVERTVEVKSDYHGSGGLFVELTVDNRPGYLYKSRAQDLLYYYPREGVLYWVDLPRLQWWLRDKTYPLKTVTSRRGARTWVAQGIVVNAEDLAKEGVLYVHHIR